MQECFLLSSTHLSGCFIWIEQAEDNLTLITQEDNMRSVAKVPMMSVFPVLKSATIFKIKLFCFIYLLTTCSY